MGYFEVLVCINVGGSLHRAEMKSESFRHRRTTLVVATTSNMSDTVIPLTFSRDRLCALEIEPFSLEFEAKIPELFSASDKCRVGVIEYLSSSNGVIQQTSNPTQSGEKTQSIRLISSLEGLNALLDVGDLALFRLLPQRNVQRILTSKRL